MDGKAFTPLRLFVLAAGALGTAFVIGTFVWWWRIPDPRRDGLELMAVAIASGFFLVLVLPTLVLGLIGRWLPFAAILGAIVLTLASDTLWHWLPWW
jgi:hypothetical protein